MADMVELKRDKDGPCCGIPCDFDDDYPVGFFLDPHMVKALGLNNVEPGQDFKISGVIHVKRVSKAEDSKDGENKVDLYACLTKMTVMGKAEGQSITNEQRMLKTYEGDANGDDKA